MPKKIFDSPLFMTWLDMIIKFGMNIILLPIATIYLLPEELAYFLFVGTLLGMAYLAEGGVNSTSWGQTPRDSPEGKFRIVFEALDQLLASESRQGKKSGSFHKV